MVKWLIIIGIVFIVAGLLLHFVPSSLNWFGKLPGDIHIKLENGNIFIPITSMIIISLLITLIINFFKH